MRHLGRSYRDWERLLRTLPRDLSEVLDQLQMGKIQVRIEQRHLETTVNRLVLGMVLSTLLLGSCFLWGLKCPPLIYGVSAFGAGGYGLAVLAGIWLWRSVAKSKSSSVDD